MADDYTAADNALDDLPGAPENYELLDMDDFLPAEAAEITGKLRISDMILSFINDTSGFSSKRHNNFHSDRPQMLRYLLLW